MLEKFRSWLITEENKKPNTANAYALSIEKISEHYSMHKGIPTDIYSLNELEILQDLIALYDFEGKYEAFGEYGNATYRNALKAYERFITKTPRKKFQRSRSTRNPQKETTPIGNLNWEKHFDDCLKAEAAQMMEYYQMFYCLEKSIRALISSTMQKQYGSNWYEKLDYKTKQNIERNLDFEFQTPHAKRSEEKIDYTTFGDLKNIILNNWEIFEQHFSRSKFVVGDVLNKLNRIRGPIAHCTQLSEKEKTRFYLHLDDWFEILKSKI